MVRSGSTVLRRSFLPTVVAWVPCQHWAPTTNFIIIATSKKKLKCFDKNVVGLLSVLYGIISYEEFIYSGKF